MNAQPLRFLMAALPLTLAQAAPAHLLSPEVNPDHSVTFRISAPSAAKVRLNLEGSPASMLVKDDQGNWSVTTPPLEPDYYGYSFVVDGVPTMDSGNALIKPSLLRPSNQVHVPGPAALSWEWNDVPHGEIHHHFYHSAVCSDDRDYYVYTPPGYDPSGAERYPTLYLLHGFSDDASGWTSVGRANVILDNLIAQNKAKPMVVVMPLGYGNLEIIRQARLGDGGMRAGGKLLMVQNGDLFQQALLEEVIPRAEKEYRLSTDRLDRAVAGLSMGGGETLRAGLSHPDVFAWVCSLSAGGLSDDLPAEFIAVDPAKAASLKLLWIACGKSDGLYPFNEKVRAYLTLKGIVHTDITTPGAHAWMVWRRNLTAFAPLLFR